VNQNVKKQLELISRPKPSTPSAENSRKIYYKLVINNEEVKVWLVRIKIHVFFSCAYVLNIFDNEFANISVFDDNQTVIELVFVALAEKNIRRRATLTSIYKSSPYFEEKKTFFR
jgi:hypothetical protein